MTTFPAIMEWSKVIGALAAIAVALKVLFQVLQMTGRVIYFVDKICPVLLAIGEEFKSNSGHTLKDKLDALQLVNFEQASKLERVCIDVAQLKVFAEASLLAKPKPKHRSGK